MESTKLRKIKKAIARAQIEEASAFLTCALEQAPNVRARNALRLAIRSLSFNQRQGDRGKADTKRKAYERKRDEYRRSATKATNARQRWTGPEDRAVMDLSLSDKQIAEKIGRSVLAVKCRRARLAAGSQSPPN